MSIFKKFDYKLNEISSLLFNKFIFQNKFQFILKQTDLHAKNI